MKHTFNVKVAEDVGANSAVLLEGIRQASGASVQYLCDAFPYLTVNQIRSCLKKLEDSDYVGYAYYSENPMDRTKGYCITDKARKLIGEEE